MEVVKFGGTAKEQTELAELVVTGEKTATSSLVELQKRSTKVGDVWLIKDGANNSCCKVIITRVINRHFGEIDEEFAKNEGDGSFENWYQIHFNYYTQSLANHQLELTNNTLLECVYFEKVTSTD